MARYMLIMRSTPEAEAAMEELNIDFNEIIESMGRFNEELIKAGVMLAGEGLTGTRGGLRRRLQRRPAGGHRRPVHRGQGTVQRILDPRRVVEGRGQAVGAEDARWARASSSRCAGCPSPTEFPQDNPWIQKEIQWKADLAEKIAAQARADATGSRAADRARAAFRSDPAVDTARFGRRAFRWIRFSVSGTSL